MKSILYNISLWSPIRYTRVNLFADKVKLKGMDHCENGQNSVMVFSAFVYMYMNTYIYATHLHQLPFKSWTAIKSQCICVYIFSSSVGVQGFFIIIPLVAMKNFSSVWKSNCAVLAHVIFSHTLSVFVCAYILCQLLAKLHQNFLSDEEEKKNKQTQKKEI